MKRLFVLSLLLPLLLGSSKSLGYKTVEGSFISVPSSFAQEGNPSAMVVENINNQGCVGEPRLDLRVNFQLRNTSSKPIILSEKRAKFRIGNQEFPIKLRYREGAQKYQRMSKLREFVIEAGKSETIYIHAYSFESVDSLNISEIDGIELMIPAGDSEIRLKFQGLMASPLQQGPPLTAF